MRWAHSAVDYLAAAGGGDRVGGGTVVQEKGTVHGEVEGESPLSWEEYLWHWWVHFDVRTSWCVVMGGSLGEKERDPRSPFFCDSLPARVKSSTLNKHMHS